MDKNATLLTFEFDLPGGQSRLQEMILYVSEKCNQANRFGKVKLNKILWRADFSAFKKRRVPVTGRSYQKLAAGPAPLEMNLVLEEMRARNFIRIESRDHGDGYIEDRIIPLHKANLRVFSPEDIDFVNDSIEYYWKKSASHASGLSHEIAWKSRNFQELMPYESVFLSNRRLTATESHKFTALAKAKEWKTL